MQITKVSRTDKRVKIHYSKRATKKSQPEEIELECREAPLPSFDKALQALAPYVCDICELDDVVARITVKGVSLSTKDDLMYAIITACVTTKNAPGPFTLNTPRLPESSDDSFNLGTKCATAINKVVDEAGKYVKGERAQGILLGESEEDDADPEDEDQQKLAV